MHYIRVMVMVVISGPGASVASHESPTRKIQTKAGTGPRWRPGPGVRGPGPP